MPVTRIASKDNSITLQSRNSQETFHLGEAFGREAVGGEMIALIGDLGTGKTQFVKGLAKGLDIFGSAVSSPTYVLAHMHKGRLSLTHVDLYRLENAEEIDQFGLEEYIEGSSDLAVVEWADKGLHLLPEARLMVFINDRKGDEREIRIQGTDKQHRVWIDRVLKQDSTIQMYCTRVKA